MAVRLKSETELANYQNVQAFILNAKCDGYKVSEIIGVYKSFESFLRDEDEDEEEATTEGDAK